MKRIPPNVLLHVSLCIAATIPFACSKTAEPDTNAEPSALEIAAEPATGAPEQAVSVAVSAEAPVVDGSNDAASAGAGAAAGANTEVSQEGPTPKAPQAPTPKPKPEAPAAKPEPPAGYTGPDPCRTTNFKFASVRSACAKGGIKQAKSQMKGMVKRAKDDGKDIKCSSCHENTKTYPLKPNAVEDMRALQ
jgi:hypothetical protein